MLIGGTEKRCSQCTENNSGNKTVGKISCWLKNTTTLVAVVFYVSKIHGTFAFRKTFN